MANYAGVTATTRHLLQYWSTADQFEVLETAIWLAEVADRQDGGPVLRDLRQANETNNPLLLRTAFKMATGAGKTTVMGKLIVWQCLNRLANAHDGRFTDCFLVVTPGITIKDGLRVLVPNDPESIYRKLSLVPDQYRESITRAKIIITNYHQFRLAEKVSVGKLTKQILDATRTTPGPSPFTETPEEMVRRVCRGFGTKKNIMVLNDEAHHCYRRKPDGDDVALTGEDRREAEKRNEEARLWISGLEAMQKKIGIRMVYDLSATPFFLRGSGYPEGTHFPWVVSDFSLIDAIESGIVKVPRVPIADNAMVGDQPTYRDLWLRIRDHLPKKGRGTEAVGGEPKLPAELEGALHSLFENYRKQYFEPWESDTDARAKGRTPPVFIVVCNNANVSKLIFDYVSEWERELKAEDGQEPQKVLVPGELPLFSNVESGLWSARPKTILIGSEQLESGEAMSDDFRRIAARGSVQRRFWIVDAVVMPGVPRRTPVSTNATCQQEKTEKPTGRTSAGAFEFGVRYGHQRLSAQTGQWPSARRTRGMLGMTETGCERDAVNKRRGDGSLARTVAHQKWRFPCHLSINPTNTDCWWKQRQL